MEMLCECNSVRCMRTIDLPVDVAYDIVQCRDVFVIVSGCPAGPSPTDILFEERDGYSLYKENQDV